MDIINIINLELISEFKIFYFMYLKLKKYLYKFHKNSGIFK